MGIGVGDYDLDGHIDIFKTHFQQQATGLYRNDGKGNFDDVTVDCRHRRRAPLRQLGSGHRRPRQRRLPRHLLSSPATSIPNWRSTFPQVSRPKLRRILFRNLGNGTFAELGEEAGPAHRRPPSSAAAAPLATSTTTATWMF